MHRQAIERRKTLTPGKRWLTKQELKKLIAFLGAGVVNTAFGYFVFAASIWAGCNYQLAVGIATVAGICFNFAVTGRLVFGEAKLSQFLKFIAVYVFIYYVNLLCLSTLLEFGLNVYLAYALITPPVALLTFLLQLKFVYRPPDEPSP
jgi:putative flippase GtrA